jgi:DNA polymerase III delta prime subunit
MEEFLWVEKYRPGLISECILPKSLKDTFQDFVNNKQIPNLILSGGPGTGKTTVARAMLEELGCDYIIINGSLNGNIDTLRNEIQNYASASSLTGGRKYVILDEADSINPNSFQPALRNFMEEFSQNCGFILTCNFINKIISPLHSRCSVITFKYNKSDIPKLASQFFKRVTEILDKESITYDKNVVATLVSKYYPDGRRVINELQRYASSGSIDTGILSSFEEINIKKLVDLMKQKDYTGVRKWVYANLDSDPISLYRSFYDNAANYFTPSTIPLLVILIGKYQYQNAFAADPEINLCAFLAEAMIECEYV